MGSGLHPTPFVYRVNRRDQITWVNDAWLEFARDNDASELDWPRVISHSLWEFVHGADMRALYEAALAHVREYGDMVTLSLRCDAPDRRCRMHLTIAGHYHGEVEFVSEIVREEKRPVVRLLDRHAPRSDECVAICSWCKRVEEDASGEWVEIEDFLGEPTRYNVGPLPRMVQAVCPKCYGTISATLDSVPTRSHPSGPFPQSTHAHA